MEELEAALEAAEASSRILKKYFRKPLSVRFKKDKSPVTLADIRSEKAISSVLQKAFPEYGMLSEESGEQGTSQDTRWIVDPLDGTRSFVRGLPFFGPLIALEKNGRVQLGVMTLPALGETLYAVAGKGCFWNGRKVHTSKTTLLSKAFVVLEIKRTLHEGAGTRLLELASKAEYVRGYSDIYAYFLVATGQADAFVEGYPYEWDVAAPKIILQEAGGRFARLPGKYKGLAVASNRFLFRSLQQIL